MTVGDTGGDGTGGGAGVGDDAFGGGGVAVVTSDAVCAWGAVVRVALAAMVG